MQLSLIDLPSWVWIIVVIAFWGAVVVQWLSKNAEIEQIQQKLVCRSCGKSDLEIRIHVLNQRSKQKVGLLKNVWLGMILLVISVLLFIKLTSVLTDLIQGTNLTGIQNDTWIQNIGTTSFFLLVGIGCAVYGIYLLLNFFVGPKERTVQAKCLDCGTEFMLE